MADIDEESIHDALYQRLKTQVTGLGFTKRGYIEPDQIPREQQPAMCVAAIKGQGNRQFAVGTIWTLQAMVIFYVRDSSDPAVTVETTLLGLIKQVDAALKRQPTEIAPDDDPGTTLGGLVFRCFRVDHELHHGIDSGQSAASMTIEMVRQE